jgi:hypothetical protein
VIGVLGAEENLDGDRCLAARRGRGESVEVISFGGVGPLVGRAWWWLEEGTSGERLTAGDSDLAAEWPLGGSPRLEDPPPPLPPFLFEERDLLLGDEGVDLAAGVES